MLVAISVYFLSLIGYSFSAAAEANYFTNKEVMSGFVFPREVDVIAGEDLFIKFTKPVEKQQKCLFRRPGKASESAPKEHVAQWNSEKCGIQIKNVSSADAGVWHLISEADDKTARGVTVVHVKDDVKVEEGRKHTFSPELDVGPERTSYCYVSRPNERHQLFPQHEKCPLPDLYDVADANGHWKVTLGAEGKTDEVNFKVEVSATRRFAEEIIPSVETDLHANILQMNCKLINSMKTVKFCRFARIDDDFGFNLVPGRGHGKYRYYGNGLDHHECGMAIQNPIALDKTQWKCLIGTDTIDATEKEKKFTRKTIGAIVDASTNPDESKDITAEDVYGLNLSRVNILCRSNFAAEYCWFRHASGRKITISDLTMPNTDDEYRYFGSGIRLGECGITIMQASVNDSGTWSCHMGSIKPVGLELSKEVSVRVSDSHLVAASLFQDAELDDSLLLECRSVHSNIPIKYCRFTLPDGNGFSIDETATESKLVMGNFYFNPNRNMKAGFCSIVVKKVSQQHIGEWTCAGLLAGRNEESWDDFRVNVLSNDQEATLSAAAITGMVFGVLFMLVVTFAAALMSGKRGRNLANYIRNRRNRNLVLSNSPASSETSSSSGIALRDM